MKHKKLDYYVCLPLLLLWFAHIYMSYKALYLQHSTAYSHGRAQFNDNYYVTNFSKRSIKKNLNTFINVNSTKSSDYTALETSGAVLSDSGG